MNQLNELQRAPHSPVWVEGAFEWLADAHAAMAAYYRRWQPDGYMTTLHVRIVPGGYMVEGHRYDNCD